MYFRDLSLNHILFNIQYNFSLLLGCKLPSIMRIILFLHVFISGENSVVFKMLINRRGKQNQELFTNFFSEVCFLNFHFAVL